jgi:hypothetical protein
LLCAGFVGGAVMSAHTPGPWRVNTDDLSSSVYGYVFSETGAICRVFLDGNECEANIRLIAATPDLLAALQAAVDHSFGDFTMPSKIDAAARDAIRKATGAA